MDTESHFRPHPVSVSGGFTIEKGLFLTFPGLSSNKSIILSSLEQRITANSNHNVFWEHSTVSLGSILSVFLELALEKTLVSQLPLSSWTNTTAYSIPESQTLHALQPELPGGHADFICSGTVGDEDNMLYSAVLFCQCGRGGCICSASPGKKIKDVSTSWSPPLPVFGDRKKLLSPFSFFQIWKWMSTGLHLALDTSGYTKLWFGGFI